MGGWLGKVPGWTGLRGELVEVGATFMAISVSTIPDDQSRVVGMYRAALRTNLFVYLDELEFVGTGKHQGAQEVSLSTLSSKGASFHFASSSCHSARTTSLNPAM